MCLAVCAIRFPLDWCVGPKRALDKMVSKGQNAPARKIQGKSSLDGICDGVTPYQKGSRYGVINASEKNVVTAAARASRSSRSFGGR